MYTIYVSCVEGDELNINIKKSSIHYNNNLIYGKQDISISEIMENISESQYIIADITNGNILSGIVVGISLEKGVGVIALQKDGGEGTQINKVNKILEETLKTVITYKEDYKEAVKKIEDIIQKM